MHPNLFSRENLAAPRKTGTKIFQEEMDGLKRGEIVRRRDTLMEKVFHAYRNYLIRL